MPEDAPRVSQLPSPRPPAGRSQRVLACVLCQQRKVKCDRRFPCANCTKNKAQCVPAIQARRQRRLFPERELLERLRKYEELLRSHDVKFEPFLNDRNPRPNGSPQDDGDSSDDERPQSGGVDRVSPSASPKSEDAYNVKSIWQAISQEAQGPGTNGEYTVADALEGSIKAFWHELPDGHHILFGAQQAVDLSTLHPDLVDIFRLWQVFIDNVNPLLKVTHTPTLQSRIIEAARDLKNIEPTFEALLFSIYSIAIHSLEANQCQAMFGLSQTDLSSRFQFACQQALTQARFLQSTNRDCLTALYFYLLTVRHGANPQSVCAIFGVAVRLAQCMGIHNESSLSKYSVFEGEMRRRLWWSLMLYDSRLAERADHKEALLNPTWDCKVPLNVNDSDLRPEMNELPVGKGITDALFVVVRSEIADSIRHTPSHLEFANPALKPLAKGGKGIGSLDALEKRIEEELLVDCDPENPLHFMTIWTARASLDKSRLTEHYSKFPDPTIQTDVQRDQAVLLALSILEWDTRILTSALTRGFAWLQESYFPFPQHMHVLHDLRRRPLSKHAEHAWGVIGGNCVIRFPPPGPILHSLLKFFGRLVLSAWEAHETAVKPEEPAYTPEIVMVFRQRITQTVKEAQLEATQGAGGFSDTMLDDFLASMPTGLGDSDPMFDMDTMGHSQTRGQAMFHQDNQFGWDPMGGS